MKATFSEPISAADWIDLLISKAPDLRRAGVIELAPDRVVLRAYQEPQPESQEGSDDVEGTNPWSDAVGMGFEPGTKIPNFGRRVEDDGE